MTREWTCRTRDLTDSLQDPATTGQTAWRQATVCCVIADQRFAGVTMAARIGMPGLSVYSATKAALESLTRTWAAEFSPAGIRVNTVAPGPTRTDMVLSNMGEDGAAQVGKTTLLGRLAAPREIAEVVLFLASDRAAYITGATIAADAGRTAV